MTDVENILNDEDFFGDIVDTLKKHSQKKDLSVWVYTILRVAY